MRSLRHTAIWLVAAGVVASGPTIYFSFKVLIDGGFVVTKATTIILEIIVPMTIAACLLLSIGAVWGRMQRLIRFVGLIVLCILLGATAFLIRSGLFMV